jgi:peptidyl-prolyl cis-trans isomerase C
MENKVLATINGKEITENDINKIILTFPKDKQQQLYTEAGKARLLDQIISLELIYLDSKEKGYENDEAYINEVEAAKKDILTQYGVQKVFSTVSVSEDEAKAYYEANLDRFKSQGTVRARHILVETEEEALKVKKEIEEGKAFEEAAKKYSMCPSNMQGGDLGNFTRGQMVPEFEDAAFSQAIGQLGEPVKTQFGYHLIRVDSKSETPNKPFEEVKLNIIQGLKQERQNMKYVQHIEGLKEKYNVEVK